MSNDIIQLLEELAGLEDANGATGEVFEDIDPNQGVEGVASDIYDAFETIREEEVAKTEARLTTGDK